MEYIQVSNIDVFNNILKITIHRVVDNEFIDFLKSNQTDNFSTFE